MAKSFIPVLALVSVLALPTMASASSNGPLTREQVRAELVQLQQAGHNRHHSDAHYPADVQAALENVATQQRAQSGYGGVHSGSAVSGAPARLGSTASGASSQPGWDHSIYKGS
ncbi:hypothetical protein OKW30_003498 [Paraburkholderia sp. Clong3]|uniref:DUF4148 domain-containing protein n=1 Tax=Paraburkholderia sp. Clong3 TaxID=2991061 RepID=UPI003D1E6788